MPLGCDKRLLDLIERENVLDSRREEDEKFQEIITGNKSVSHKRKRSFDVFPQHEAGDNETQTYKRRRRYEQVNYGVRQAKTNLVSPSMGYVKYADCL